MNEFWNFKLCWNASEVYFNTIKNYIHINLKKCTRIYIFLLQIDRYKLRSSFEAGVNKVSVHLDNEPVPTRQRAIGAYLSCTYKNCYVFA